VTGIILAKAGWSVLVVERNDTAGGAIRTEEVTLPGFRHDLFATNLNLFAGSAFFKAHQDELVAHGLEFVPSTKPFASVFPGSKFVGVTTDLVETVASIATVSEADAAAWRNLSSHFERISPHIFPLLGVEMPSSAAVGKLVRGMRSRGIGWPLELTRMVLQSTREFTEEWFESDELRALVATWGMHLDFAPDVSGGALFPYLETFADAANGMVLGKGGADVVTKSLTGLLEASGGDIRLGQGVDAITISGGRATGVVLETGERVGAGRALVANLTPTVLATLLPERALGKRGRVDRYRYGPGTSMVHLALDDLPDWSAGDELRDFAYVHIGPYMDDMSTAYNNAVSGRLPMKPTLVVGQPTTVDPTRAPEGKHVLWIQVRMVPGVIKGDAGGEITDTDWETAKEPFAERVIDLIEEYAPGLRQKILARQVLSPSDLEEYNPNLVRGDSLGGSHHLMQNFFLRPLPGWRHYRTPIRRLHICGAATWPGAGVGAGSGYLLGKRLTRKVRLG
jgi:phytoene dehydrogenase-like protein